MKEYRNETVAYLVKEIDGKQRYITNKPNHPDDATYNIQRRNARRLTGLEEININWDEHLIDKEVTTTIIEYTTYSFKNLEEVDNEF